MANNKYYLEDEDDMFVGSPKSKYFDIARQANDEIVEDETDNMIEKLAVMEILLSKGKDMDFDINSVIKQYLLENSEEVDEMKKGFYIEFTGDIVCRLDS